MKYYSEYHSVTGQITKSGACSIDVFEQLSNVIEGAYNDLDYFIHNGLAVARPKFILDKLEVQANNIDKVTCSGLPIPFTVQIDTDEYVIDDGVFEFSTDIAGEYKITPLTFPYFRETITVTVR